MGANVRHSERLLPFSLRNLLKYQCTIQFGNLCLLLGPKSDTAGPQESILSSSVRQGTTQRYMTSFRYSFFIGRKSPNSSCVPPDRLFKVCFVNKKKPFSTYSLFLKYNRPKTHKNVYVTKPDMF